MASNAHTSVKHSWQMRRLCSAFIWKNYTRGGRQALLGNQKLSLQSAIHLQVKAISWRTVSEKFQSTTLEKASILFLSSWRGLVHCLRVVLFVRRGYKDFQEPGNNSGLLHSCGRMCATDPYTIFFTLWQVKSNSSTSLHPSMCAKIQFMSEQSSRICIIVKQDFNSC